MKAPPAEEWLVLDEAERIALVGAYHRRANVRLPNATVHASLHVIVENQAALGDEIPVNRTLDRLIKDGIDRHEAIHAVASVLAEHMAELILSAASQAKPIDSYYAALETLTVESCRQAYG